MKRMVALLVGCLVWAGCGGSGPGGGGAASQPPQGALWDQPLAPTFESIELKIDPDRPDYTGAVRIEFEVEEPVTELRFHAEEMSLERVELQSQEGPITVQTEAGDDGLIRATAERELAPGHYTLEIDFSNEFDTRAVGLYRMEHEGRGYLFTQLEAADARKAFPCWDEPRFKIPFQMTLHVPEAQRAVSNTPVESETAANGWKTLVYRKTNPLPTYLLAIAAGPLEGVPIPGLSVPGRIYTVAGQSHLTDLAAEVTPPVLAAMEQYFGSRYPYEKLDLIAIPEFWPGAMENPGAVTYADSLLLLDPRAASVSQRRALAAVTAHELAHMWFGNLVTMRWWDDLWLNESFASWLGDKITHELYPQYKTDVATLRGVNGIMQRDARPSTKPIRKPVVSTSEMMEGVGVAYGKGKTVLNMMEQWLGRDVFRKGVGQYIEAHAWGNAVASDLWNALSEASGKDVAASMSGFLDQPGFPLVNANVESGGVVELRQQRFLNYGVEAPSLEWTFPVHLKYSDRNEVHDATVLLDRATKSVDLGSDIVWVMPNAGGVGYYRWQVPTDMLLRLAESSQQSMDARERVAFLGNAAGLLDAGAIGGDDYLKILDAFSNDPDPDVVSSLLSGLGKIELAFVPDELTDRFAVYVRRTLRPALERFGIERKAGEDEAVSMFRPRLFSGLGGDGQDDEVRSHALSLARAYMDDPTSIDPALAGVALGVAAIDGDRELFEAYRRHFENARTPVERRRYLSVLGAFDDPEIQDTALRYALEGPIRPTELFSIPQSLPDTEAANARSYRWLKDNYETIASRIPPEFRAFLPFAASGCSEDRLRDAQAFFTAPERKVGGVEANLARVADQVKDCVSLRQREGAVVAEYLSRLVKSGQRWVD